MREAASFIARQGYADEAGILIAALRIAQRTFRSWLNRRRIASLTEVDDHLLADLGLDRDDVRRALDLPFAQDPALELQRVALRNRGRGWNV